MFVWFQVKGIFKSFKQPIAYYLNTPYINEELDKMITALDNIGLNVVACIHGMGPNLMATKRALNVSNDNPHFIMNGRKRFFLVDVPHLLKALRNNLLKHCLFNTLTNEFANWDLILKAFMKDNDADEKLLPKLNKKAIFLDAPRDKMRVSYAAKVISGSMAFAISTFIETGN